MEAPWGTSSLRSNPDSYFQGNPRVLILPLQVLTVTLLFTKLPCCVLLAGTFFRGVLVSVNSGCFSPSRFSHFHCNAMRKAIKVHKNCKMSTPQRAFSRSLPMDIFSILYGTAGNYGAGGFLNSTVSVTEEPLRYLFSPYEPWQSFPREP